MIILWIGKLFGPEDVIVIIIYIHSSNSNRCMSRTFPRLELPQFLLALPPPALQPSPSISSTPLKLPLSLISSSPYLRQLLSFILPSLILLLLLTHQFLCDALLLNDLSNFSTSFVITPPKDLQARFLSGAFRHRSNVGTTPPHPFPFISSR